MLKVKLPATPVREIPCVTDPPIGRILHTPDDGQTPEICCPDDDELELDVLLDDEEELDELLELEASPALPPQPDASANRMARIMVRTKLRLLVSKMFKVHRHF